MKKILFALLMLAGAAQAQVVGTVANVEQNKGSASYFYRYTIAGISSGCGSALTSSTTYLWLNHEAGGSEPYAKQLHDSIQLAKVTGATIQVWFSSDCHITDVVQL